MAYLLTYILGIFATLMSLVMINHNLKSDEEINMSAAVISSILWPAAILIGLIAGIVKGILKVYNHFAK